MVDIYYQWFARIVSQTNIVDVVHKGKPSETFATDKGVRTETEITEQVLHTENFKYGDE